MKGYSKSWQGNKPWAVLYAWMGSLYLKWKHFAEACSQRAETTYKEKNMHHMHSEHRTKFLYGNCSRESHIQNMCLSPWIRKSFMTYNSDVET